MIKTSTQRTGVEPRPKTFVEIELVSFHSVSSISGVVGRYDTVLVCFLGLLVGLTAC